MFPLRDHNPSRTTPIVTTALIAINVVVFLMTLPYFGNERALMGFYSDWALIPAKVIQTGDLTPVFTSMFLHGGFMHIIGNMLFLWIFGDN
ncbi:MAG: rhomboid family intramembrane serine protease, partial [Paracoccaceae bacterium]|nr:rhomboid family intramembrane serine protease [Paracoccaceae bacterium]